MARLKVTLRPDSLDSPISVATGTPSAAKAMLILDVLTGRPGQDGQPGTPGLSAYQIWLSLGNSGTAQDFLASLVPPTNTDARFVQPFSYASEIVVQHNLGKYPSVTVIDTGGTVWETEVQYDPLDPLNKLTVTLHVPFSGQVICN